MKFYCNNKLAIGIAHNLVNMTKVGMLKLIVISLRENWIVGWYSPLIYSQKDNWPTYLPKDLQLKHSNLSQTD